MSDLYEQDFIGWTEQQARLLRQAASAGSNLGLDWGNLIEEVEGLGRSQYRALASQLRRVMVHLLKLEFSPATGPRAAWQETIADARAEVASILRNDPGLKPRLAGAVADEWPDAARLAVAALRAYREDPIGIMARQRSGTGYTEAQILGDWLPERPDLP